VPAKLSSSSELSSVTDARTRTGPPVWVWAVLIGLAALAAFHRSTDPELWFHLGAGRSISQHGLPSQEIWSRGGHGQPAQLSEWLFHVALYQVHRIGGDFAIALWRIAWAAATMALAIRLAILLGAATWSTALLAPLLLSTARDGFEPNPQQILIAFLSFAVVRFEEARQGADHTRWLIPVQALWANLESTWAGGPIVAWIYAATAWIDPWRSRRAANAESSTPANVPASRMATWAALGLVLWAASAIVPQPLQSLANPFAFLRGAFDPMGWLHEGRMWSWNADRAEPFTAWILLWLIALAAGGRRMWKESPALTVIAMGGMVLGVLAFRYRALAAWTSFAAIAVALVPRGPLLARAALAIPAAAAFAFGVFGLVTWPQSFGPHPRLEPVPVAAAALAESLHLEGPMLNTYSQGGYLLWARGEKHPPFIDGRGRGSLEFRSLYARSLTDQFSLDSLLDQQNFNYMVLQPPQSTEDRLAVNIARRLEWGLIFYDDSGLLYTRWNRLQAITDPRAYRYFTPDYFGMLTLTEQARADSGLRIRLEAELQRARAASPAHSRASMWLGLMALGREDAQSAVKYLDEAYRIAPQMPGLALRQAMAHEMMGDARGAIAAYRRALRDDEDRELAEHSIRQLQGH